MQRVTLVRYTVKPDRIEENDRLSRAVFDELRATRPEGIVYALYKEPDGASYVHLFANLRDDSSEAVTGLPSFVTYQANIGERCSTPPSATRLGLHMLDGYGLPSD